MVMNRRDMLKLAGGAVAASAVLGVDAFAASGVSATDFADSLKKDGKKKKALIIGAHPDDPETGCGGTMVKLQKEGFDVVSVYLTKGEAGIPGTSYDDAAAIRVAEAKNACEIMGARPVFLTQIDGSSEVNQARYAEMRELIDAEKPDIVFTHWPVDSHADHRVCYTLVYDAWRRLGYCFELYFFEVMSGVQTQLFHPTDWVDITDTSEIKKKASFCHISQKPENWYTSAHEEMEIFRGMEFRCKRAEAFVHARRDKNYIY